MTYRATTDTGDTAEVEARNRLEAGLLAADKLQCDEGDLVEITQDAPEPGELYLVWLGSEQGWEVQKDGKCEASYDGTDDGEAALMADYAVPRAVREWCQEHEDQARAVDL